MPDESIRKDVFRYLTQLQEKQRITWSCGYALTEKDISESVLHSKTDNKPGEHQTFVDNNQTHLTEPMQDNKTSVNSPWALGAPDPVETIPLDHQLADPFPDYTDLESFNEAIHNCIKCPLGKTRIHHVFGAGDPKARLVLVGEAPGAEEDAKGDPFVGRAGQLLDRILAAINLNRNEGVYICNILKCRPPQNRDPQSNEVEKCEPYLLKQLQLIQPDFILALGRISAQTLLRTTKSLTKLRGTVHDYHGIPLVVTFHPAALLRNPHWKEPTWEDMQMLQRMLEESNNK